MDFRIPLFSLKEICTNKLCHKFLENIQMDYDASFSHSFNIVSLFINNLFISQI